MIKDKEKRYDNLFMSIAKQSAQMSFCKRSQVGAVIVRDNRVVVNSWNGTITGSDNSCEEEVDGVLVSKNTVVHAEANALMFAAKNGIRTEGCKLYVTLSPCIECSKLMIQAGIKEVVYEEEYRVDDGIKFLKEHGVNIRKFERGDE